MQMQIETDVPLPEFLRSTKYPFSHMAVNESVFFSGEAINGRAYRAAMTCGARHKKRFVVRREGDGIRVWRAE
jgi:hypothetical protein